jgi:hypothetical protein
MERPRRQTQGYLTGSHSRNRIQLKCIDGIEHIGTGSADDRMAGTDEATSKKCAHSGASVKPPHDWASHLY